MTLRAGFDVGGTNARVHLFDEHFTSLAEHKERIRDATAPEEVAATLVTLLKQVFDDAGAEGQALEAIGIGLAGQLSVDGRTVLNAPNLGWRDLDFVSILEEALRDVVETPPSILLINDLNAQVWGEHLTGSIQGVGDVLAVYAGTGVGGALVAGGRLISGCGNNAGEIGHSKVVVGGRLCGCGERGCLEAYAGGVHLEELVAAAAEAAGDIPEGLITDEGVQLGVADRLATENEAIAAVWEEATDYLSLVIANACTLLNPAVLLLGGGVLENCRHFRNLTVQKTLPLVLEVARRDLDVRYASKSDISGMLGAADLASRLDGQ